MNKELLLTDSFDSLHTITITNLYSRRSFLTKAAAAGIGLIVLPQLVKAEAEDAWKNTVTRFVETVCGNRASAISGLIGRSKLTQRSYTSDFHQSFSAPFIFESLTVSPYSTDYGNYFEVARFPLYDQQNPCRRIKDLNAWEIRRITNRREIERFECVLSPCNERQPLSAALEPDARNTIKSHGLDPRDYNVEYARPFRVRASGKQERSVTGYAIAAVKPNKDGKTERDLLLSTSDV